MPEVQEAFLFRVLNFAAEKHRDQRRKDIEASPYINHPIAVGLLLAEHGVDDREALAAALLHDTLEDTNATEQELRDHFGAVVTDCVLEVSDDTRLPLVERRRAQVEAAPHLSHRAKLVKLADKIANLRDVADRPPVGWSRLRRRDYFDWGKEVVDGLRGVHPGLEALFDEVYARRP